jgi:hypothetical protein
LEQLANELKSLKTKVSEYAAGLDQAEQDYEGLKFVLSARENLDLLRAFIGQLPPPVPVADAAAQSPKSTAPLEVRTYIEQRVSELTKGGQKPSIAAFERDQDFELSKASHKIDEQIITAKGQLPAPPIWLFPDSSERLLSREELIGLSQDDLWRARNELFARRGYIFTTRKGKSLAVSLGASYMPISPIQEVILGRMGAIEKANVQAIQQLEKKALR